MKKPFLAFKRGRERRSLFLFVLLGALGFAVLLLPSRELSVFTGGGDGGMRGLFNIISGWAA
ncbi:MAG: hypothetical protein IKZ05_00285 [Clostridia bacterium]|nr:hypothetical protein [Clostridia bacterium]